MKRTLAATLFCICLCAVANAQPGAAQKAAVEAAKEWRFEKVEIGWDRGPVLKIGLDRENEGTTRCVSESSTSDREPREKPDPADRGPREKPDRDPGDRGPKERPDRDPSDRGSRDRP